LGNLRERADLEDQGLDLRLMDLQEGGWGMDWIDLAEDRDRWKREFVNSVINLRVP
jgi:hypothetical protein